MPPELGNLAAEHKAGRTSSDDPRGRPGRILACGGAGRCSGCFSASHTFADEVDRASERCALWRSFRACSLVRVPGVADRLRADAICRSRWSFENSHSAKPFIYKVAGAWGNHEGSMLLWVTVLGLSRGALAHCSTAASRADLDRRAWRAGGASARLPRLPAVRFESVRAAESGAARGTGAQPAAPGSGLGVPSADALPRLCRPVGRVQHCGRCDAHRRCRGRRWPVQCGRGCSARGYS